MCFLLLDAELGFALTVRLWTWDAELNSTLTVRLWIWDAELGCAFFVVGRRVKLCVLSPQPLRFEFGTQPRPLRFVVITLVPPVRFDSVM